MYKLGLAVSIHVWDLGESPSEEDGGRVEEHGGANRMNGACSLDAAIAARGTDGENYNS